MNRADEYMINDIENILLNGYMDENPRPKYSDGTPAHTLSVNHVVREYDLASGEFPITSLRPIAWKSAIKEILWIYQDSSNNLNLLRNKYGITYWDQWESKDIPGTIGKRYGYKVAKEDSIRKLLTDIKNDPYGRRKVINLWDEEDFKESDGLYPCAFLTNWNVRGNHLDMILVQRSGDMICASGAGGINEVQYAALLLMIARHTGLKPGKFTHVVFNEQIYDRHIDVAKEMYTRGKFNEDLINDPFESFLELKINKSNFYDITIDDFVMFNYNPIKPNFVLDLGI